jgi:D-glycero-D-manno-heptose 1,7-bisphosphate phosphatase
MSNSLGRRAVFLDRDGTVIYDRHYLADPEGVELLPGVSTAIAALNRASVPVVLVTNQSGIGRGLYSEAAFREVQLRMQQLLAESGARLDATYYCSHPPDLDPPCDCRKPAPGLFVRAARDLGLDLGRSFYVGDRARDLAPTRSLGGTPILVRAGGPTASEVGSLPDGTWTAHTLEGAVAMVIAALSSD